MRLAVQQAFVGVDLELAELGGQPRGGNLPHQPLVLHPVLDQVGDGDERKMETLRQSAQLGHARHRAVARHDLANDTGRRQAGEACQIDRRFGVAGADEDASLTRAQRKHVTRAQEILRLRVGRDRRRDRRRPIGGGDAGARAASRVDRHAHGGFAQRRVDRDLERNLQRIEPIGRHGQADESAAVRRHEVDQVRSHLLGGNRQVAFVLTILVVDDDHHPPLTDRVDRFFDGGKRPAMAARPRELQTRGRDGTATG